MKSPAGKRLIASLRCRAGPTNADTEDEIAISRSSSHLRANMKWEPPMDALSETFLGTLQNTSTADWLQMASIATALGVFFYQQNKSVEAQQTEIYQRLEIESSNVFRFEAEHSVTIRFYKKQIRPTDFTAEKIDETRHIARKYYETTCNMFEVACRLRHRRIMPPEVFGSWVAWYFDTLCEWGFRAAWADLRDNYIDELRTIFDPFMDDLVQRWDQAAASTLTSQNAPADPEADVQVLRGEFYRHLAKLYNCPLILNWLRECKRNAPEIVHPYAYS
ncbi:MAG: hypothetical protein KGS44_04725 [Alphaproteobacteria bacterium]|nr:hypothetical protein [Alphaproteobacteria bacterium]